MDNDSQGLYVQKSNDGIDEKKNIESNNKEKENLPRDNYAKFVLCVDDNGINGLKMDYWDGAYDDSVRPFFMDLKMEILESKLIEIQNWQKIILKAEKLFKSEKAKKIKYCNNYSQHGFDVVSMINLNHLIALILYTDNDLLPAAFCKTFRKQNALESDESVRQRNGKFYYFGRYLSEAVNDFGVDGSVEKGPFFCGINGVLKVGSFAICFVGPCSTTKNIEVAKGFTPSDGSIIELQNDGNGRLQKFFDVSWISQYSEEAERLWINGNPFLTLRIVTVHVMNESVDYKQYFHALYVFDAMMNGQEIKTKIEESDYEIMNALINGNDAKIPQFIKDSFLAYRHQKKKIDICPYVLDKCFDKKMVNLFMNPLKNYNEQNNDFEDDKKENHLFNVPKPFLFDLFSNLEQVQVWSTNGLEHDLNGDKAVYKFELSSFLSFIDCAPSSTMFAIFAMRKYDPNKGEFFGQTWLENLDFSSIDTKKYNIMKKKLFNVHMNNQHFRDTVCIKKPA